MKVIRVVAAVICDSMKHKTQIFSTARGYGEFKGGWEFPGGKIEQGETPQAAVVREIREELDVIVKVGDLITTIEYDYPTFHLSMDCFWCEIVSGDIKLKEHEAARWLTKEMLGDVEWLPADVTVVGKIGEDMN
ncbi:(deoxy)nucleoside triphosphate pyrophosphohydrolase [Ruminococcus sp. AM42-11]|uniref:(deoxy)nucleoside triphosphate pyrophosphohydrolase n=1 Tax=Ruminococcus sp. AM42-11 TaxID=2292372 RepID=UPI000E486D09|nr:(deoxy)nucleoside triphosphate pyrophosphohydrolase [Ruminococcus sp. AM42-11]RHS94657.1 (deoxy)nucleoside triphosphate pyrophosphohydrolase [Ruminococcus sp. AM42-11]